MHKSLLRVEDWAPKIEYHKNPYWSQLLRLIDQFQELVQAQKKQIIECVRDLTTKRLQLTKLFYNHKTSLLFQNQLRKQNVTIYDNDLTKQFFHGYYSCIRQIIKKISDNPIIFAKIIGGTSLKKLESFDFAQNIAYNLYPCYLPWEIQKEENNKFIDFVREIINRWQYSIDHGRPRGYAMIDQIINGINKSPQIVCYVQKISIQFMKELNKCKMDIFAFDEQALRHEMQAKRNSSLSTTVQLQKKSRWTKLKSFFKPGEKDSSYFSQTSEQMDPDDIELDLAQIMKVRQQNFINVVKRTIEAILKEPTPYLLNQMMKFFHEKLIKIIEQGQSCLNYDSMINPMNRSVIIEQQDFSFVKKNKSHSVDQSQGQLYRHYSYFIMTNLIFEELHNKFTISHEDTGMSPADLQNITEIIRIMSNIFQGKLPEGQKYKSEKIRNQLKGYLKEIPAFYEKIFIRAENEAKNFSNKYDQKEGLNPNFSHEIRQIILHFYENTLVLSFNDIRSIVAILKTSPYTKELQLSQRCADFSFLENQKYKGFFAPGIKRVDFNNKKHEIEKILFVFNSSEPTIGEIIDYYTGKQSPLKNLPILTKALMYGSNLQVSQSLQINKALSLIQPLPLKQIKHYLKKISIRYNNLWLKDSQIISQKFLQTISIHLKNNLQRKSILLLHRDQLLNRILATQKLISYYCDQLQSSQLYDRISEAFIHNIKIKVYMRIQNDELKIYSSMNKMEGVHIKSILMSDGQTKNKKFSEDYLLRNSFKSFSTIKELLQSIVRNNITRTAIVNGRRVDEFNETFHKICEIILSYIEDFMKKRQIFQNINKEKLGKLIVGKLQDQIYTKCKSDNILNQDLSLKLVKDKINKQLFFEKDLKVLKVDWDFLITEGCKQFKIISKLTSISDKMHHFEELFKIIYTIVGFNIPKQKITAEIINPIIQYVILHSNIQTHYECLFALQSLRYNTSPQNSYNLILYQSSLVYVTDMMANDYPLP